MASQVAWPSSITSSVVSCVTPPTSIPKAQDERSPDPQVQWPGLAQDEAPGQPCIYAK